MKSTFSKVVRKKGTNNSWKNKNEQKLDLKLLLSNITFNACNINIIKRQRF